MKNTVTQVRAPSSGQTNQAVELGGDHAPPLPPGDGDPANPGRPAAGNGLISKVKDPALETGNW